MRVNCSIAEVELEGDYGEVEGLCATCSRCGNETESYGTSDASVRRCLVPDARGVPQRGEQLLSDRREPVTASWRTLGIHAARCPGCATAMLLLRWKAATLDEVAELLCRDGLELLPVVHQRAAEMLLTKEVGV